MSLEIDEFTQMLNSVEYAYDGDRTRERIVWEIYHFIKDAYAEDIKQLDIEYGIMKED